VAEHGALAECEHGGEPPRVAAQTRVADGEHGAVKTMQLPGPNASVDGAGPEARRQQLLEADDAVLSGRDPRDLRVGADAGV
jgi:hypothetical protein